MLKIIHFALNEEVHTSLGLNKFVFLAEKTPTYQLYVFLYKYTSGCGGKVLQVKKKTEQEYPYFIFFSRKG